MNDKNYGIRFKVLVLVIVILVLIIGTFQMAVSVFSNDIIYEIESQEVESNLKMIENIIKFDKLNLENTAEDWAFWTDTYEYMENQNLGYINSNLDISSFSNININIVAFISNNGEYINDFIYNFDTNTQTGFTQEYKDLFSTYNISQIFDRDYSFNNIVFTSDGVIILVSKPILKSDLTGEVIGNLVFGRLYREEDIKILSGIIGVNFEFVRNENNLIDKHLVYSLNSTTNIIAYARLSNIANSDDYIIKYYVPRIISSALQRSFVIVSTSLLVLLIITPLILMLSIDKIVISRLLKLKKKLNEISILNFTGSKINISKYGDEITAVEMEINSMLDKVAQSNLENYQIAYYDDLTGLPNRAMFYNTMNEYISQAKLEKKRFFLLFIDLDEFKRINDTAGYVVGNQLLLAVANRVRAILPKNYFLSRIGGDEFLAIAYDEPKLEIEKKLKQILRNFQRRFVLDNTKLYSSVSMGIASFPNDGETTIELVKHSSVALRYAKENGKKRYQFFNTNVKSKLERESNIIYELSFALVNKEFYLVYQPIVNITNNSIIGFEALVRWNNPKLGVVSPGEFIPLAEKSSIINDIGLMVLMEMCRQSVKWLEEKKEQPIISINVSSNQFINYQILNQIYYVINKTKIDPKKINIEITESVFARDMNNVIKILNKLKSLGCLISIDDFGSGYSSLQYINALPIDFIKIDSSFVQGIGNPKQENIVKMIIKMAEGLDIQVIAEGVETKEQADFLIENNCKYVQGYYFYKPTSIDEIKKMNSFNFTSTK